MKLLFSGIGGFARGLEATDFFEKGAEKWKP